MIKDEICLGAYGFYEAIDFTPARVAAGEPPALIAAVMAHHHGMSLLALGHAVLSDVDGGSVTGSFGQPRKSRPAGPRPGSGVRPSAFGGRALAAPVRPGL